MIEIFQVAIIYTTTRVFVNLSQVYVPFYLQDTLNLKSSSVASIPLVVFGVGFAASTAIQYANRKIGQKLTYLIGCGMGELCLWDWVGLTKFDSQFWLQALQAAYGSCLDAEGISILAPIMCTESPPS